MTAEQLIALSRRENRTATEYPETREEYDAIVDTLRVECDNDCEGQETSGDGHDGAEARGWISYWGDGWSVDVVNPG